MAITYDSIATTTLSSETNSIVFSSIPGTYTDLRLVMFGVKPAVGNSAPQIRFNSDSATNYSWLGFQGLGGSTSANKSNNTTGLPLIYWDALIDTVPKLGTVDIMSYAGSTRKSILNVESSDRNGSGRTVLTVGMWRSTSAITSITIYDDSGRNFGIGTIVSLYGILRA